jgi:hypothetical protein
LAVIIAAFAEAHIADTDMVGPWKSFSFINWEMTVEGSMLTHVLGRTLLSPDW